MGTIQPSAREQNAKQQIIDFMIEQGFGTFARLFNIYTFILTKDKDCIGYTTPDGVICMNEGLTLEGFSFVCRHEILHNWLNHHENFIHHVGKKLGLDPETMSLEDINKATQIIYGDPRRFDNIAKDWDLSRYYTEDDKYLAKHLNCCGQVCEGLVLEMDRPEWLNLTAEEMYDKLIEEAPQQQGQEGQEGQEGQSGQDGQGGQEGQDGKSGKSGESGTSDQEGQEGQSSHEGQKGQKGRTSKVFKMSKVQIGDRGNEDIQKAEQEQRAKQVQRDIAKGRIEERSEEELEQGKEARISALKKEFSSTGTGMGIESDVLRQKRADAKKKKERANRYKGPDRQTFGVFKQKIEQFCRDLRNQANRRGRTWSRMDRKNQNPRIMKMGKKNMPEKDIPVINVYLDMSGSCSPYAGKIIDVADMLKGLEAEKLCKCNIFYFAMTVGENPRTVGVGNAWGADDLVKHAKSYGAQNLIVCTDDDIDMLPSASSKLMCEHAWLLTVNGCMSRKLEQALACRIAPEYFEVDEGEAGRYSVLPNIGIGGGGGTYSG